MSTMTQQRWEILPDTVKWAIWVLKNNGIMAGDYLDLKDCATQDMEEMYKVERMKGEQRSRYDNLAIKLQELWPKGMKDGKWRWRGEKKDIALRLKRMLSEKEFANTTDADILRCARIYTAQFEEDCKYMCLLPYFILKLHDVAGKKVYKSKLADMLLSKNESEEYEVPVIPEQLDYGEKLG